MPKCYIVIDRDQDRLVNRQTFSRVTVGKQEGVRNIREGEAVTLYLEWLSSNGLYYPVGRIYLEPLEAHRLADSLETMAKAIKVGHE